MAAHDPPLRLPDLSGRVVLLVDDNDDHLDLLLTLLHACRARVLMARDVDTALVYLHNAHVDLLISDLAMPERDGLALIQILRSSEGPQRAIPAIAVSGFPRRYAEARSYGFDAFLQKPVDPDSLAKLLGDFLASSHDQ